MKHILVALFVVLFAHSLVSAQASKKSENEILNLRDKIAEAVKSRDRKMLGTLFTDDFTHTHAIGKVDDKSKRLDALTAGDVTFESVKADEISIRFHGKNTAVAVGQTTIEETIYRWTIVYIKDKKGWRVAASQASKKT